MNTVLIRWLDKNIGGIFCFFLTIHRKVHDVLFKPASHYKKYDKILFIKLVEQGSTVLAYPALKRAQSYVGKERLYFMVFKENRQILDILDIVLPDHVIEIDSGSILRLGCTVIRALVKIHREKIGAVVDMEFFSRGTAVLAYLTGAPKRVGLHAFDFNGSYRGDLFTHRLLYNPYLHTRIMFLSLLEALRHNPPRQNIPMAFDVPRDDEEEPYFTPTREEIESLRAKVEKLTGSSMSRPIVVLNPNRGDLIPARRWPEKNFVRLGRMINERYPTSTVVVTGTLAERKHAESIASNVKRGVSLAGHTSLRELLTLYSISDVLVTNDSGPAHFSALTPIKSVILFGPETPLLYRPLGKNRSVISSKVICSPCVNVYNQKREACTAGRCMSNISAEEVFKEIRLYLGEK